MKRLFWFLFPVLLIFACRRDDTSFSVVPSIELKGVEQIKNQSGKDSQIVIRISYTDGDGDIGLEPWDTAYPFAYGQPYFFNLKVDRTQKKNGVYEAILDPFTLDTLFVSQRLPMLTPPSRDKSIRGDIVLRFDASPYPNVKPDTIRCKIQLIDRQLRGSNVLDTKDIGLSF